MNKFSFLKKICFFVGYTIIGLYVLFLILPLFINPFLPKYSENITKIAEESCGLKIKTDKLKIVTTPKLTVGIKIVHISASTPQNEEFLNIENSEAKLSLIPILWGRIEADKFSIEDIDTTLKLKPDGNLEIIDFLPDSKDDETKEQFTSLPFGLKLSNKLPNIYIKEYSATIVDMRDNKEYTLQGGNLKITDFVINKSIKVYTDGKITFDKQDLLNYELQIANYVMPNTTLDDLIFNQVSINNQTNDKKKQKKSDTFNIIDIFRNIKKNGLTANTKVDVHITGEKDDLNIKGLIDIEKLSMIIDNKKLPDGHIKFNFKDKKALTDINLYTAEKEITSIAGEIIHGKNPAIDIKIKSNAGINNIFKVLNSIATSFNYNELKTLSATGVIDADFSLKSDLKKLTSSGYLKIPSATVKYALYNLFIDKIKANVELNNNNLNIENISFTILSQPLNLHGTITSDAVADLHLNAENLLLKGVLAAAGQINILKENNIKSGLLSLDATAKGPLKKIEPQIKLLLNNINVLNKPSNTNVQVNNAKIDISSDLKGIIDVNTIKVLNPNANFILPKAKITLDDKNINIADTYLTFDNSRIDIKGKINDYTNKNMSINLNAKGAILANDIKQLIPADFKSLTTAKGSIPILFNITGNNKTQNITFQMLSTPNGYLHITDLYAIKGKSMLINSEILVNGNLLTLNNTGAYVSSLTSLSDNTSANNGGTKVAKMSGGINLSDMKLNSVNIATLEPQTITVPTFNNSQAKINVNITLNGNSTSPNIKGTVDIPSAVFPTIKTTFKDITIEFGKTIIANMPSIIVDNSDMSAKATINPNIINGIIINNLDYNAGKIDSDRLLAALANITSGASSSNSNNNTGIIIQNGKGNITNFSSGKIIATNLTSDFNLKNNIFTLKNLTGTAFNGKFNSNIACNIINGNTTVDMNGNSMKAVDAIAATSGIVNALSGTLSFDTKLTLNGFAPNYNSMLKSVKGDLNFEIKNGNYLNIGTIDQFIFAGNIVSNVILKAVVTSAKTLPVVKNSSAFSTISGKLSRNLE